MRPIKKTKANAGETLVEVVASIFLFLIMMGILEGAIHYSSNALNKNKEIRSDNAKIIEALQNTAAASVENGKNVAFRAANSDLSVAGNQVFAVSTDFYKKEVNYTDEEGKQKQITFYLYQSPDTNSEQNSVQSGTPSGGGGN